MEEKKSFLMWIKEHKKQLIIAGFSIASIVGIVIAIKNRESIMRMWESLRRSITKQPIKSTERNIKFSTTTAPFSVPELKVVVPVVSKDFIDYLTGIKCTATELGDKVLCSPQTINKRIVAAGLATKLPCGEYSLTEVGRQLGEQTKKTTSYGHAFSNLEWDAKVLEIIFSEEELLEIGKL